MATFLLRKEDENGNTIVIPIKVEIQGRGIVTNPPDSPQKEAENG